MTNNNKLEVYLILTIIAAMFVLFTMFTMFKSSLIEPVVYIDAPKHEALMLQVSSYISRENPSLDLIVVADLAESIIFEIEKHKLPLHLVLGLIKTESNFKQYAMSSEGAMGFWQVSPKWHLASLSKQPNKNLYDPVTNSSMGAQILKTCINKHKTIQDALSCYNGSNNDKTYKYANKVMAVMVDI